MSITTNSALNNWYMQISDKIKKKLSCSSNAKPYFINFNIIKDVSQLQMTIRFLITSCVNHFSESNCSVVQLEWKFSRKFSGYLSI